MLTDPVLWERMNKLFTVIMVLDRELNIVRSSDTLQRYLPQMSDSPPLPEIFEIKRPAAVRTFEDMRNNTDPLYLMVAHDGRFAVRGQVIDLGKREGEFLCFAGSPWLSWFAASPAATVDRSRKSSALTTAMSMSRPIQVLCCLGGPAMNPHP